MTNYNFNRDILTRNITTRTKSYNSFALTLTDEYEIHKLLSSLSDSVAAEQDNIPAKIFKLCRDSMCYPIAHICNMCISTGIYPKALKKSLICPIYKGGDRDRISNYRPISLLQKKK